MNQTNRDRAGNIQHEISPVVGWLRMALEGGLEFTPALMESAVERMMRALENAKEID